MSPDLLSISSVQEGVEVLDLPGSPVVLRVDDLSPGVSDSRVFRVRLEGGRSLILKIPGWTGETSLDLHDPWLARREQAFFESGLAERLPGGVRTPALLKMETREGRTWLWMEDLGSLLDRTWRPDDVIEAARRSALFDRLYRREEHSLTAADWLEREGYAAYEHLIPLGHENLDRLPDHPRWSSLFSTGEIVNLHGCLDRSPAAIATMRALPVTLVHGDFHIQNVGFDGDGTLVCLDWAHAGLAPAGYDIAILAGLYRSLGDFTPEDDLAFHREIIAAYSEELERSADGYQATRDIERAFVLTHLTLGLHLHLGGGLGYVLSGGSTPDAEMEQVAADIREGCLLTLRYADSLYD